MANTSRDTTSRIIPPISAFFHSAKRTAEGQGGHGGQGNTHLLSPAESVSTQDKLIVAQSMLAC